MRKLALAAYPGIVLAILLCVCFARMAADPTALIVDGQSPSVDHANHGDPRPIGNDVTFVFLPHHLQVERILRTYGHLPAWDSSGFGGRPMIGNPQGGLFYPPVWLMWAALDPAALGWLTMAHLFWGALGVYVLARRQGLETWPATVAAGVFQASPYLLAQTFEGHYPHVWAACWFPWAFWAYFDLRQGQSRGLVWLPPILALAVLAGHPQEWYLLVVTLSGWVVADACMLTIGRRSDAAWRLVLSWIAALTLCLGLAAIDLAPIINVASWNSAGSIVRGAAGLPRNYVLHSLSGFQLFSPWALGDPRDHFGPDNYWETVFSCGVIPLLLIAVGLHSLSGLKRRAERFSLGWIVVAIVSIWFAAGPHLGLYSAVYRLVPGMGWFRVPARSLFLTVLAVAMMAGFGLQTLRLWLENHASWRRLGALCTVVGGMLIYMTIISSVNLSPTIGLAASRVLGDPVFFISLAATAFTLGVACLRSRLKGFSGTVHVIGLLALAELAFQGQVLLRTAPASRFLGPDPISEAVLAIAPGDASGSTPRVRARDSFYLDLQAVQYGIEKTNVNDVFQLGHAATLYQQLYAVATSSPPPSRIVLQGMGPDEHRRLRQAIFDRMAVGYLVSDSIEEDPRWPVAATGTTRDGQPFVIQCNPTVLPRAYVVPRAELVADDATLVLRRFLTSDPRQTVLLSVDPLASLPAGPRQSFTPARWTGHDPDRPVLEVATTAPGLLVIADTWMPGWTARVNGQSKPVVRGNHCQRVIPIETPGLHRIELEYQPPALAMGGGLTLLSALTWTAFAGLRWKRNFRSSKLKGSIAQRAHGPHQSLEIHSDAGTTSLRN